MDTRATIRTILFRSGSESLSVTPRGDGTFQLEDSPVCRSHPHLGDVIQAELLPDGGLKFIKIVKPSGLKQKRYLLSSETLESENFKTFLHKIEGLGGYAERVFGGLLILSIPKALSFEEVERELKPHANAPLPESPNPRSERLAAKMTDSQKINLGWVVLLLVLGVAALIRMQFYPPQPSPAVRGPWQETPKAGNPECARILKQESSQLGLENSADDADARTYLREFTRLESSAVPQTEKEIALRRLTEKYEIKDAAREANSDIAFIRIEQKLKDAGCLTK